MNNPSLSRWGSNIYWTKLWYSDNRYSLNLKQDNIMLELIPAYFLHGITTFINIFKNKYWFYSLPRWDHSPEISKYYRWTKAVRPHDGEVMKKKVRNTVDDLFPFRLWIFKVHGWVLLNYYWFRPFKRKFKERTSYKLHQKPPTVVVVNDFEMLSSLRRYKLFLTKNYYSIFYRRLFYKF
jgi:hypothetical protein